MGNGPLRHVINRRFLQVAKPPQCFSNCSRRSWQRFAADVIAQETDMLLQNPNPNQNLDWLVVSTHLKNISQNGNLPQIGMKIKNV